MINPLFARMLGALWTAGHRPSIKERIALKSESIVWQFSQNVDLDIRAREILTSYGYQIDPDGAGYDLVQPLEKNPGPNANDAEPMPGHVVETTGLWNCKLSRLQGFYGTKSEGFAIANASGSWNGNVTNGLITLGSGGPASIFRLDLSVLEATGKTMDCYQWDFATLPAAHEGVTWKCRVPVWKARELRWVEEREAA